MSIVKKSDVKNHLSLRFRTKTYLAVPVLQPDAGVRSMAGPDAEGTNRSPFAMDYSEEHTIAAVSSTPVAMSTGTTECHQPGAPEGTQA